MEELIWLGTKPQRPRDLNHCIPHHHHQQNYPPTTSQTCKISEQTHITGQVEVQQQEQEEEAPNQHAQVEVGVHSQASFHPLLAGEITGILPFLQEWDHCPSQQVHRPVQQGVLDGQVMGLGLPW